MPVEIGDGTGRFTTLWDKSKGEITDMATQNNLYRGAIRGKIITFAPGTQNRSHEDLR